MMYRFQIWCTDRNNGCPNRCFGGGIQLCEETYTTPQQAYNAGYSATRRCTRWDFLVVDDQGMRVPMGILAPVGERKKKGKKWAGKSTPGKKR